MRPKQIAAAYLRLFQSRQSAPEELSPPDAKPAPKDRKPFGPSTWFAVSVGRAQQAEARWLLPLLCRAGNISKADIGAIRIQQSETFVELGTGCVAGFLASLKDGKTLQDGVTLRQLSGPPDLGAPARASGPPRSLDRAPRPYAKQSDPSAEARPAVAPAPHPQSSAKAPHPSPAEPPARPKAKFGKPGKHRQAEPGTAGASAGPKPKGNRDKPAFDKTRKPYKGKPHSEKTAGATAPTRPGASDPSKPFARPGKPGPGKGRPPKSGKPKFHAGGGKAPPKRK